MIEFKKENIGTESYPLFVFDSIDKNKSDDIIQAMYERNFKSAYGTHKTIRISEDLLDQWVVRATSQSDINVLCLIETNFESLDAAIEYVNDTFKELK